MSDVKAPTTAKRLGPNNRRETRKKVGRYTTATKVRCAFFAGQGMTAGKIAEVVGIDQGHKVRSLLRSLGINLLPESKTAELMVLSLQRSTLHALGEMADRAGVDPRTFAERVITMMVVEEPTVLRNLFEEAGAHEQR